MDAIGTLAHDVLRDDYAVKAVDQAARHTSCLGGEGFKIIKSTYWAPQTFTGMRLHILTRTL
jgi:hypothetical protein